MVAATLAKLMFVVPVGHSENVSKARLVLPLEQATASASIWNIPRTLVGVFSDDNKQTAGRS